MLVTAVLRSSARPVTASISEKGEADKARFRRFQTATREFAAHEKAYIQGQYRWMARQHARAQSAFKRAIEELKTEWNEEPDSPDDTDIWGAYYEDDFKTSTDKKK